MGVTLGGFILAGVLPKMREFRYARWAAFAESALKRADAKAASLWASRLSEVDSRSLATARFMAAFSESVNFSEALYWRARVSQLLPGNTSAILEWARVALRGGRLPIADRALGTIPAAERDTLAYNSLAAAVAVRQGRFPAAERFFEECVRLDPVVPMHLINLAGVRLKIGNANVADDARRILDDFSTKEGELQVIALRTIARCLLERGEDRPASLEAARKLVALSQLPADRLTYLEALRAANSSEFRDEVIRLETLARQDAVLLPALAEWLNGQNMPDETVRWLGALGNDIPLAAQLTCADAFIRVRDWPGLRAYAEGRNFGQYEFLRLALLARAAREQGMAPDAFRDLWRSLLVDQQLPAENLFLLAAVTQSWGWREETEGLWQQAARGASIATRGMALARLFDYYYSRQETEALRTTVAAQVELDPGNPAPQNNLAFLNLLRNVNERDARESADRLYAKYPKSRQVVATQALSLIGQERWKDALTVIEALGDGASDPSLSLYAALALEGLSENVKALEALERARGGILLPEERKRLQQCEKNLKRLR